MLPLYPAAHEHPDTTSNPSVVAGHPASTHPPLKYGAPTAGTICPKYPASHTQSPAGMLVPLEFPGHGTAEHPPL